MKHSFQSQHDWICPNSVDEDLRRCAPLYSCGRDADIDSTDTPADIDNADMPNHRIEETPVTTLDNGKSNTVTELKGINMYSAWVPAGVLPLLEPIAPWRFAAECKGIDMYSAWVPAAVPPVLEPISPWRLTKLLDSAKDGKGINMYSAWVEAAVLSSLEPIAPWRLAVERKGINMHSAWVPAAVLPLLEPIAPWRFAVECKGINMYSASVPAAARPPPPWRRTAKINMYSPWVLAAVQPSLEPAPWRLTKLLDSAKNGKGINMYSAWVPEAVVPSELPPWRLTKLLDSVNTDVADHFAKHRVGYRRAPSRLFQLRVDGNNKWILTARPCDNPPPGEDGVGFWDLDEVKTPDEDEVGVWDLETRIFLRRLAKDALPINKSHLSYTPFRHSIFHKSYTPFRYSVIARSKERKFRNTIWQFIKFA